MILDFTISWVVMPMLTIGLVLGLIRMAIGPTLPDRVVAFDMITIQMVGILVSLAILRDQSILVDVATIWAIISFLTVIAIAFYIQRWRKKP